MAEPDDAVGQSLQAAQGGSNEASPSPSAEASAREQAEALQRALARLPEDYRRVVVLRYREERSFAEIGMLMDRSADAARKLWARAMERLREEWTRPK